MVPIRVAIIGLSVNSVTSWASTVHLPYFLSPSGRKNYQVVALLNSSLSAATTAREHYGLPQSVKTYGDPQALASDRDVDLVVCTTHVAFHFDTIAPSLKAGKRVFVEWPLVASLDQVIELQNLTTDPGIWERSIIGLQGRVAPPVQQLMVLLQEGRIGKVLSSDIKATGRFPPAPLPLAALPESVEFTVDKSKGANGVTIAYGHVIDFVHAVLGEWDGYQARTQIERPEITLVGSADSRAPKIRVSDIPDLITIHGAVKGKNYLVEGATLSVRWRNSLPFKAEPAFVWTINGEKGDIQLISPDGPNLGTNSYNNPVTIKLYRHATNDVEEVVWKWQDWQNDFDLNSRSTAELYERYAAWIRGGEGEVPKGKEWPTLVDALVRMREVTEILSISAR